MNLHTAEDHYNNGHYQSQETRGIDDDVSVLCFHKVHILGHILLCGIYKFSLLVPLSLNPFLGFVSSMCLNKEEEEDLPDKTVSQAD